MYFKNRYKMTNRSQICCSNNITKKMKTGFFPFLINNEIISNEISRGFELEYFFPIYELFYFILLKEQ